MTPKQREIQRKSCLQAGSPDICRTATGQAIEILENHRPDLLPEGVQAQIRAIVQEVEAEMGIKQKRRKNGQDICPHGRRISCRAE